MLRILRMQNAVYTRVTRVQNEIQSKYSRSAQAKLIPANYNDIKMSLEKVQCIIAGYRAEFQFVTGSLRIKFSCVR